MFRTHELRPGWAPSIPRGRRCSSRTGRTAQPAPAALPRLVLQPRSNIPPCEAPLDEASTRVQAIHPSGLPLARGRPDGTGRRLGFPPELRTPPTRSRTTRVEVGTGHRARTWNYQLNITSGLILQCSSSLIACDLASHVRKRQRSTAALASTSWLLRSTSGDGVGSERVIAIVANHWPCIGAGMPAITRGVVRREGQDRPPCCCPAWKGALCSRPPDGRLRALASVRAANRRGRCGTSRSLSRGRPILQ